MVPRSSRALVLLSLVSIAAACDPQTKTSTDGSEQTKVESDTDTETGGEAIERRAVESENASQCTAPEGKWYLHLSDVHLGASVAQQQPGGDTSKPLWEATKAQLRERLAGPHRPAFVLYTGDLPDHTPDHGATHDTNIEAVLGDLKSLVDPNNTGGVAIPLLYLPGNNDSLDCDYGSFTNAKGETALSEANWSGPTLNLPAGQYEGDATHGYYSVEVIAGLRVIALNTVMMASRYPCAGDKSSQDELVREQLKWLETELAKPSKQTQKVLLAMHIPPGIDAYGSHPMWVEQSWEDEFLRILEHSPSEIVGLAYGHTHLDELRRIYDTAGKFELLGLSAPGITPGHGNNPGFKAVSLDASFRATDALTWYASAGNPAAPAYRYEPDGCYRYSEVFGCDNADLPTCLGGREICDLAKAMETIYTVNHGATCKSTAPGIEVFAGGKVAASCPCC